MAVSITIFLSPSRAQFPEKITFGPTPRVQNSVMAAGLWKRARFNALPKSSKIWPSREKCFIVTRNWLIIETFPSTMEKTNTSSCFFQRLMRATRVTFTIFDGFQFHLELFSRINVSKIVGDDSCAPWNIIGTFIDRLLLTDAGLLGYTKKHPQIKEAF